MKSKENPDDILSKYKVYLKLEKSLSDNTVSAYLADISKLFQFLADEQIHPFDVALDHLETFPPACGIWASNPVHKHAFYPASVLSTIS